MGTGIARSTIFGPSCVVATFVGLLVLSWRRWCDVVVDFGRELYVPWQLCSGKVLYRDIAHLSGPLSQYVNAAAFRVFGVSLATLVALNLAFLVALTAAIYWTMRKIHGGELTPALACVAFLVLSGYSHSIGFGNYNFVCPYAHELTHGTALVVALNLCLIRWIERGSLGASAGAGIFLGLAFLTKAEAFVAALACALVGVGLRIIARPSRVAPDLALLAAASAVPPLAFLAFFANVLPAKEAARATLGAFTPIFSSNVTTSVFYVHGMGLDRPFASLPFARDVLYLLAGLLLLEAGSPRLERRQGRLHPARGPRYLCLLAGAGLVVLLVSLRGLHPRFLLVPETLPVFGLPLAGATFLRAWSLRHAPDLFARAALAALWATFGLAFLLKIALRARADDYGFALAMPGYLLLLGALVGTPPRAPEEPGRNPRLRAVFVLILLVDLVGTVAQSAFYYGRETLTVGRGTDAFLTYDREAYPRGTDVTLALERIEARIPPDASFVVLPEGVMLNYLSRRPTPTRYVSFMPPEVTVFGEERMLAALDASAPPYVVLLHRWTGEYGVGFFGADPAYGKKLMDWVALHYAMIVRVDHVPFRERYDFGIEILRRR